MKEAIRELWPETIHKEWMVEMPIKGVVTVIIPTFNRQAMIINALNSVLNQTYRPIELIVVDDGSTDETKEAIEKWKEVCYDDPSFTVQYIYHENMGVSGARNLGLIKSHGEFIQYLDSDDLLLPNRIFVCVEVLQKNPMIEFVHSAFYLDYGEDSSRGFILSGPPDIGRDPNPRNYLWTAAGLFRRALIVDTGPWNESLRINEDSEYFSRLLAITDDCMGIPEALVIKRKHSEPRLLDLRTDERGLKDKYESIMLQDKILQKYGDNTGFANAKLWIVQDTLSAGIISFGKEVLSEIRGECKKSPRTLVRWYILFCSTILPKVITKNLWKSITLLRNEVKWKLDSRRGKIKKVESRV